MKVSTDKDSEDTFCPAASVLSLDNRYLIRGKGGSELGQGYERFIFADFFLSDFCLFGEGTVFHCLLNPGEHFYVFIL